MNFNNTRHGYYYLLYLGTIVDVIFCELKASLIRVIFLAIKANNYFNLYNNRSVHNNLFYQEKIYINVFTLQ